MRKLFTAACALVLVLSACKKTETDDPARLFRPVISGQLVSEGNWIEASWQANKSAVSYTVQLSRDTFRTILESRTIDTNRVRFDNLEWGRLYQVQVRANAADTTFNSKFSNLGSIRTPLVLNIPAADQITDNAVKVSWNDIPPAVTSFKITRTSDNSVVATVPLTPADLAVRFKIFEGLSSATAYTITLYSGTSERGTAMFTTKSPASSNTIDLRTVGTTALGTILADTLPDIASGSIVLLKRGATYSVATAISLSKSVTFTSGDDLSTTARAMVFFTSNLNFTAGSNIDSIDFRDVDLKGNAYGANYVFNTTGGATVGRIRFDNCRAEIFRGLIRLQSGATTVSNFIVNRCIIDSISNYGVITVDNVSCKADNITITNSTIYKAEKVVTSRQNSTSVLIENCTFNETPWGGGSNYIVDYSTAGTNTVTNGITINNCIFGIGKWNNSNISVRDVRASAATGINASNNYRTSDHVSLGNDLPNINTHTKTSAQVFQNPSAGNFKIIDNTFAGRSNSGDPRWYF